MVIILEAECKIKHAIRVKEARIFMTQQEQIVIIGSGPAGLTAAIYLARFGHTPLIIEGPQPGGQLMWTTYVENWPGIKRIRGSELMQQMREHATSLGARIAAEDVTSIEKTEHDFAIKTNRGEYLAQAVIIASGAHPRRLNCPGENEYWGRGVSPCAVCDGALFQGLPVVVVGGGNSGVENALFLRQYTDDITLIHSKPALTATEIALKTSLQNDRAVHFIFNSTVTAIHGNDDQVTSIEITNLVTNEKSTQKTAAVFLAIGQIPSSEFVKDTIEIDKNGTIITTNGTQTSIPGIFAAGDVADPRYRQAITASATGCMAALDVQRYLAEL